MAAPTKNKTDGRKSLQNAISGISRYLSGYKIEKLNEALSYLRKKIAADNLHVEVFRELGGINLLLNTTRKLIVKCSRDAESGFCQFHLTLTKCLENIMKKKNNEEDCRTVRLDVSKMQLDSDQCELPTLLNKALEMTVSILANCCYVDPSSGKKVSSLLGIPLLVIIFCAMTEEGILNRVCRCLANLCSSTIVLEEVVKENFIEYLVPHLGKTDNEDCQRTYIRAIRILGANKRGMCEIIKHRGIVAVASKIAAANVEVKKAAIRAILDLASGQSHLQRKRMVMQNGKIKYYQVSVVENRIMLIVQQFVTEFDADAYEQVVVSKCLTHIVPWLTSEDASQRHDAQSIIYRLLVSDQIRAEFGSAGGIDYLYGQLKSTETRKSSLLQSLLWCTRESVNRIKIRESGALDLLIDFLSGSDFAIHRADIIAGLCNFIYDDLSMQKLFERKIVSIILRTLLDLNDIPPLDISRLAKKVAHSFYSDECLLLNEAPRYSMDSPSYEHNEWEWSGDYGDVLCKTSFEPIDWHSPARSESPLSGGYSPAPSCSQWSPPASPSSSPGRSPSPASYHSPGRSPTPPPAPPSPLLPDVTQDAESDKEEKAVSEPSKAQRASNHILALLLRFTELDHYTVFKENTKDLTTCLLSYALLSEEPSKNLWILLSRLMNELNIFTEILEADWPFLLTMIYLSDACAQASERAVRRALQNDCCVEDCDKFDCNIAQHASTTNNACGRKEVKKLVEGFIALCETYYGRGTLAQMICCAVKKPIVNDQLLVPNVAVLCRHFLQHDVSRPVVHSLCTNGGLKFLVESYFLQTDPPAYLAVCLIGLAESLPWLGDPTSEIGTSDKNEDIASKREDKEPAVDDVNSDAGQEVPESRTGRKRKSPCTESSSYCAKRARKDCRLGCLTYDVTFLLDDESEVSANESILCESSEVFRAMLRGHFRESSQTNIRLKGINEMHLKLLLHDLTCASICTNLYDGLELADILELLRISDQYLLLDVKNRLFSRISKSMNVDNLSPILKKAILFNELTLIESCFTEIFAAGHVSLGRKVRILRSMTDYPLDARTILANSALLVLARLVKLIPSARNKS